MLVGQQSTQCGCFRGSNIIHLGLIHLGLFAVIWFFVPEQKHSLCLPLVINLRGICCRPPRRRPLIKMVTGLEEIPPSVLNAIREKLLTFPQSSKRQI